MNTSFKNAAHALLTPNVIRTFEAYRLIAEDLSQAGNRSLFSGEFKVFPITKWVKGTQTPVLHGLCIRFDSGGPDITELPHDGKFRTIDEDDLDFPINHEKEIIIEPGIGDEIFMWLDSDRFRNSHSIKPAGNLLETGILRKELLAWFSGNKAACKKISDIIYKHVVNYESESPNSQIDGLDL
jgi:hypothetical protein